MHEKLFASTEGRMLGVGLALTGLMLLAFGIGWNLFPDRILPYAIMTGLNLIIGREAGMSYGYAIGFDHAHVVPLNILIETIQVLVIYPLFVQSTRHLIRLRALEPFITRIHHAAQSSGGVVRKFGIAGLFVFVFAPFWMTGPVVGGTEDYVRRTTQSIRGLEVLSPGTLRIRLSKPYASFLAVLGSEPARIVPKHYVEQVGAAEFARRPIGCGPFRFAGWETDRIVLTRFSEYNRCPVYLDSLVYELPTENARDFAVSRLFQGKVSAAVVPDGRLNELQAQGGFPLLLRQELSLSFIGLNQNRKPFDDVRVRQAFIYLLTKLFLNNPF